jgi:hypothetical protein
MDEEDYGHEGGGNDLPKNTLNLDMGSEEMDGGQVYQDEDGNLIMYNHDEGMMDDEDQDLDDSYGMEGSPGVGNCHLPFVIIATRHEL